ncbi:methyl-accepting chemotaxis protein-2 (aspartate sensor receptor) [Enterobacter sp. AG5470]|nr:methyl-accepting chemotaxis protein-2 (aspartate sensor receptor) [Enterobacter sp. AG5470]
MARQITMFKNLSVAAKLFGGFSVLLAIIILSSVVSVYQLSVIRDHSDKARLVTQISEDLNTARRNRLVFQLNHDQKTMEANHAAIEKMSAGIEQGSNLIWEHDTGLLFEELKSTLPHYVQLRNNLVADENAATEQAKQVLAALNHPVFTEYSDAIKGSAAPQKNDVNYMMLLAALQADADGIVASRGKEDKSQFSEALQNANALHALIKQGEGTADTVMVDDVHNQLKNLDHQIDAYFAALAKAQKASDALSGVADKLNTVTHSLAKMQTEKSNASIGNVIYILLVVTVCAVLVGLVTAWLITRQMTRQIRYNLTLAESIAQGDLTAVIEAESTDELGRLSSAMAAMNQKLRDLISQIKESVVSVASASSQIAAGNTDLASRTEEQSAAVVETAASMEELTSTVKRNADNAREASNLAQTAAKNAQSGGKLVSDVVHTMDNITESSNKIKDIITVINGISFQTNILALNAAVEAARAGEQGRGFAVVAGEVRSLAQRSAQAAKEIEELIQESVARVSSGSEMVNKAGETMKEIVSSVEGVSGIMTEISHASDEQSRGIDQISKAMSELDTTTQQNAALVQESSAAAGSLEQQSGQLSRLISLFKLGHEGESKVHKTRTVTAQPVAQTAAPAGEGNWETF